MLHSARHSPWRMTFKDGVTKDGRIVARQITSMHDAGAYTGLSSYVVDKHAFYLAGPYYLPNVEVNAIRNGDQLATRTHLDSVYLIETMKQLAERVNHPLDEKYSALTSDPREA